MTSAQKLTFAPLELDDFDAKLDARAAQRGIPTLKSPDAAAPDTAIADPKTSAPKIKKPTPPARSVRRAPAKAPAERQRSQSQAPAADAAPTPRARMIPLNVEVPDYVWVALKSRAAQNFTSVRYHILKLLTQDGIEIAEADLVEDGRRLRQKKEQGRELAD